MESGKEGGRNRFPCATTFSGERVILAPPLSKWIGRTSYGKPAIAQARHPPQGVFIVAGGNPNWNRLLNRFGLNAKLFELKVLSCKRKSAFGPQKRRITGSEDLQNLIKFLGLEKFHLVSSAAGGSVGADYALSHPEHLLSLTVSSNNLAATRGYIAEAAARVKLEEWDDLPRWFRELGPSYRAANPDGVAKCAE